MNSKRFGSKILAAGVALGLSLPLMAQAADVTVATTAIVEHPALDAVRDGVRDELKANGFEEGKNLTFIYKSAQGNPATAAQIAREYVGDAPDVIVPIATPSAQAVVAATPDIPVVFSAVTDPVAAKLVAGEGSSGTNVTGVSDLSPIDQHIALIKELTPDAKTIGVPYNPGEANSVVLLDLVKKHGEAAGYKVIESPATKTGEVLTAAQNLIGQADVIYVATDNTIISAFEAVVKVGVENQIPVYAGDTDSVKRGAMAALGFDYYDVGRQTGKIVVDILNGKKAGEIAFQGVSKTNLFVNPAMAAKMGVTLSDDVIARAAEVVE
ncbi:ABC transporter substrate-binding protein [Kiloniella laminariae]|uniref:ABC transporter substrate-binding protein n=1 Tax=Kiloniella laminariae TaxID=454162 RepID=A0ABT4LHJ5_9PROT|nr:ABC transporter substrate-binding protein [Kiloniella laminariae]MCZ4280573.1 ABC transporter substrate-binding protein [Kiloniella laminariae]